VGILSQVIESFPKTFLSLPKNGEKREVDWREENKETAKGT
jgi:hypothetical protein